MIRVSQIACPGVSLMHYREDCLHASFAINKFEENLGKKAFPILKIVTVQFTLYSAFTVE